MAKQQQDLLTAFAGGAPGIGAPLPSEDPAFWQKVLQAPGVKQGVGGLLYVADILGRPSFALGNMWRGMLDGNVDELTDALRQFVPFGEYMEDAFGVNIAPDKKEDLGMMMNAYMRAQGVNPYVAGAMGVATGYATDVGILKFLRGFGVLDKVGTYGTRAFKGATKATRWTAEALAKQPYIGRITGGGLKYYDIAKKSIKGAFTVNQRMVDIERTAEQAGMAVKAPVVDSFGMLGNVASGGKGITFLDDVIEMIPSETHKIRTATGIVEKSIPIHSKMVSDSALGLYLSALGGKNIASETVAKELAKRITSMAGGVPDGVVTFTNRGFAVKDGRRLFDMVMGNMPDDFAKLGDFAVREVIKKGRARTVIEGAFTESVKGKRIVALASHIVDEKDVARIAEKLMRQGARDVEIVTALYKTGDVASAAMDYYARGGASVRAAMEVIQDPKNVRLLQKAGGVPEEILDAATVFNETGALPGAFSASQKSLTRRMGKLAQTVNAAAAKIEGVNLTDPVLKGYMLHAWSDEFTGLFKSLGNKEKFAVLKNAMAKFWDQSDDAINTLKKHASEYKPKGWSKELNRLAQSTPESMDDVSRFMVDGYRSMLEDPRVARIIAEIPEAEDMVADLLFSVYNGKTTSGIERHIWNMGRDVGKLNMDWAAAAREAGVKLPQGVKVWDQNSVKLAMRRINKTALFSQAREFNKQAAKQAARVLSIDDFDDIYPTIRGAAKPGEEVLEAAQQVDWRLGGRVGIVKGGPHDGRYFIKDIDNAAYAAAKQAAPKGAEVAFNRHLFDRDIGRMMEDLIRMQTDNAFAGAKANTIKGAVMRVADWFTNEMRGGMLLNSLRWPVRNMIDDTLRGTFEYGLRYPRKIKELFTPLRANPERVLLYGRDMPWDELRQIGDQWDVFMGFSSQVRGGARYRASLSAAEQLTVKAGKPIESVWQKMAGWVGLDVRGKQIVGAGPLSRNALAKKVRAVNDLLEDKRRMAAMVLGAEDAMERAGVAAGAWTADDLIRAMPEAARRLDKSIFIYSNITPWEKQVASKVMLFYPFYRKNIPFWFNQMVEKPAHILAMTRFFQYMGEEETEFEKRYKAPFLKNMLHMKTGKDELGRPTYAYGFGLSVEDVNRFVALGQGFRGPLYKFLGSLNPIFKLPMEYITGKNFFFNNKIEDWNRAYEVMSRMPLLKDFLRVREETQPDGTLRWRADGRRLWWLQNIGKPLMDVMPVLDSLYRKAGWAKGRGQKKLSSAVTGWLTGMNIHRGDPQMWSNIIERDTLRQALQEQKRRGVLKGMESWYLPKGYVGNPEEEEFMKRMLEEYGALARRGGVR